MYCKINTYIYIYKYIHLLYYTVGGKNRAPLAAPERIATLALPEDTLDGCNAAEEKEVEWTKSYNTGRPPESNTGWWFQPYPSGKI